MTTFRKGDRVSIVGTIRYEPTPGKKIFVAVVDENAEDLYVPPEYLTLVAPAFEVGDMCSWLRENENITLMGKIIAISDGHAWIFREDKKYLTLPLTALKRIDSYPGIKVTGIKAVSND